MLRSRKPDPFDLDTPDSRAFDQRVSGVEDENGQAEWRNRPDAGQVDWPEDEYEMSVLQGIGRVFITVGLLVLSFLGYQLWGTNANTNQTQRALDQQLGSFSGVAHADPTPPRPEVGEGMARIRIPKIGVERVVVEGVDDQSLKKGPGHYPETAFPGKAGNVVISGHRTTYGAPFYRLDELGAGDEITLEDASGIHTYKVREKKIVLPNDLSVVVPSTDARLTLTTCHPRFSAKQRLIVVADLVGAPK